MRVIQVMDGVPMSARAQSRGSWEHSAEICVVSRGGAGLLELGRQGSASMSTGMA